MLTVTRAATGVARPLAASAVALAGATALAAVLRDQVGLADASPVYLLAVVAVATRFGTWPAVATSLASFLVYDFLFTAPRLTLAIADPQQWLSLLLFLLVAVVVGRLAALQTARAEEASRRAAEAQALFMVARALATAASVREAGGEIVERLRAVGGFDRTWIALGEPPRAERRPADTASGAPLPDHPLLWVLQRTPGDEPARWVRVHVGGGARPGGGQTARLELFRVAIQADGRTYGWVGALRGRAAGAPDRGATRLLALAADQLGLALRREALATEATSAEVARRSDALKSALLDSVSHDLRTPLANIRTLAGSLLDDEVAIEGEGVRRTAAAIDERAAWLSDVVQNLLDLSRIEAGAIQPHLELHDLDEIVEGALRRLSAESRTTPVQVDLPIDLPPVLVDAVFIDEALGNVLQNALRHAGPSAPIRVRAERAPEAGGVDLIVEDGGPGVPEGDRPRLFEKFFRSPVRGPAAAPRGPGMGIGLSVARGLAEAMGATVSAEASPLGGLAIRFRIAAGPPTGLLAAEAAGAAPGLTR